MFCWTYYRFIHSKFRTHALTSITFCSHCPQMLANTWSTSHATHQFKFQISSKRISYRWSDRGGITFLILKKAGIYSPKSRMKSRASVSYTVVLSISIPIKTSFPKTVQSRISGRNLVCIRYLALCKYSLQKDRYWMSIVWFTTPFLLGHCCPFLHASLAVSGSSAYLVGYRKDSFSNMPEAWNWTRRTRGMKGIIKGGQKVELWWSRSLSLWRVV